LKKYLYIVALTVFILSLTITVSATFQFASELVDGSTVSFSNSTTLLLIAIGIIGLAGSSNELKK